MEKYDDDDDESAGNERWVGESQSEDTVLIENESEFPDRWEMKGERPGLTMAHFPRKSRANRRADTSKREWKREENRRFSPPLTWSETTSMISICRGAI